LRIKETCKKGPEIAEKMKNIEGKSEGKNTWIQTKKYRNRFEMKRKQKARNKHHKNTKL